MTQESAAPVEVIAGAYAYGCRVDSWLGGRWLGQVPVLSGSVAWTTSQQVQGSLTLRVPRVGAVSERDAARDFTPTSPESPLACFGQVLRVALTVRSVVTGLEWTQPAGSFIITASEIGRDSVSVTAKSILHRVEEDRLTSPMAPRPGGTLASEARRLLGGHMGLVIDAALRDRQCPTSMSWGESRVDALFEIADAWPARLREGPDGVLRILPPVDEDAAPSRVLTDGQDGTVVGVKRTESRSDVFNRVVARGQDMDDRGRPTFQAVADQTSGPLAVTGPYGTVTKFFSSPLITSQETALASALSMLASSVRRIQAVPVEHAPDPTLGLDDVVIVRTAPALGATQTEVRGIVTATEMPLTHEGTARTDIEVVS